MKISNKIYNSQIQLINTMITIIINRNKKWYNKLYIQLILIWIN